MYNRDHISILHFGLRDMGDLLSLRIFAYQLAKTAHSGSDSSKIA